MTTTDPMAAHSLWTTADNVTTQADTATPNTTTTAQYSNNRLNNRTVSGLTTVSSSFSYSGLGEFTKRQVGTPNPADSETAGYDAAGHTGNHTTVLNPADTQNAQPGSVDYVYDGMDRPIRRIESPVPKRLLYFYNGPSSSSVAEETPGRRSDHRPPRS